MDFDLTIHAIEFMTILGMVGIGYATYKVFEPMKGKDKYTEHYHM